MTVREYLQRMRRFALKVALTHGCGLPNKDVRAVAMGVLCVVAVLVKLLVDRGVLTNAELAAAFDAAEADDAYDPEPNTAVGG